MLATNERLQNNYKTAVFDAMIQFQQIEFYLKECIRLAYKLVQERTKEDLDFTFDDSRLNKLGLHALCSRYKSLTKNKNLIQHIKELVDGRNEVAHEACFNNWLGRLEGADNKKLHRDCLIIQQYADDASALLTKLLEEKKSLEIALR